MTKLKLCLCVLSLCLTVGCANQQTAKRNAPENKAKIADINTRLGIEYLRDGDHELAVSKLEKALEADPNYAPAHSTLGLVYFRVGEFDSADKHFRRALQLDPKNSSILNNYGQVLCQHGDHEKGQQMFLKANENPLYSSPEIAFSNAGVCAMAAGDDASAESHFRKALEINPRLPAALLRMAKLNLEQSRYLPARAYLQRYDEISTLTAESLWLGVRIENGLDDKDAAASYRLKLLKAFPDSEETQMLLESEQNQ